MLNIWNVYNSACETMKNALLPQTFCAKPKSEQRNGVERHNDNEI